MRIRVLLVVAMLACAFAFGVADSNSACNSQACRERVAKKKRASCKSKACKQRAGRKANRRKWRAAVEAYGPGLLAARRQCESGNNYRTNTGNGFFGAYQFDLASWQGAGGHGMPHDAAPLEQDYRAVRWDGIHGGDPWPNCP